MAQNMPYPRSSAPWQRSSWMRRVMFAKPVTSVVIVSVSWCWPPAHDELKRLQNHSATRRLGDEDFLLAIA